MGYYAESPGAVVNGGALATVLTAFGDAGRNIIEGPGEVVVDMSLSKTITVKESRALELRLQAANVFNFINYTGLNTTVNSLQFGQITSAAATRRVTLVVRFRF